MNILQLQCRYVIPSCFGTGLEFVLNNHKISETSDFTEIFGDDDGVRGQTDRDDNNNNNNNNNSRTTTTATNNNNNAAQPARPARPLARPSRPARVYTEFPEGIQKPQEVL